jgi:hypothetical protein|tara:strand:+ start:456 stop:743 length:288 start_codon:yes stop_codon:yes gene_type:complete
VWYIPVAPKVQVQVDELVTPATGENAPKVVNSVVVVVTQSTQSVLQKQSNGFVDDCQQSTADVYIGAAAQPIGAAVRLYIGWATSASSAGWSPTK